MILKDVFLVYEIALIKSCCGQIEHEHLLSFCKVQRAFTSPTHVSVHFVCVKKYIHSCLKTSPVEFYPDQSLFVVINLTDLLCFENGL